MLIEGIRKVTLKNHIIRIECITYGPDGGEQLSGVMHLPAGQAGEVVQSISNSIRQLQQMQSKQNSTEEAISKSAQIGDCELQMLHAGEKGPSVILLHGAKFNAATWKELGTLSQLAQTGYQAWAVDLPGYGQSGSCKHKNQQVIASFLSSFDEPPVLVGPSMSGALALEVALYSPDHLSGLVLIAPTQVENFTGRLSEIDKPVLVLWGDKDKVVNVSQADILKEKLPNAKVSIFEGGQHPCYLDQPKKWHEELLDFLAENSPVKE